MAFDFKKEYRDFYLPGNVPSLVAVPRMNYIAVRGTGDPNREDGEYKRSIGLLYGVAFTIKMSRKTDHRRWRASGGRRASAASITAARMISGGSPASACRIS